MSAASAANYAVVERRQLPEPLRVLVAVNAAEEEIAVAYGHSAYWHMDLRPVALAAAGLPVEWLLHGFWVATEAEARAWLNFVARLVVKA